MTEWLTREQALERLNVRPQTLYAYVSRGRIGMKPDDADPRRSHALTADGRVPMSEFLGAHQIIVNCVLQDPNSPVTFLVEEDLGTLAPGTLVIDVSCDDGMGFSWARPTSFTDPTFTVGDNIRYYGVDHSPSYLWNSATWEISEALLPHLRTVLTGPDAWATQETIHRAVEIRDGVIQNPAVLSFQHRSPQYPHAVA